MKHHEDLTRLHVNEAIQTGLKSQSTNRALAEESEPAPPMRLEVQSQGHFQPSSWVYKIQLVFHHILDHGE